MIQIPFKFVDAKAASGDITAQKLLLPQKGSSLAAGLDLVAANEEKIVIPPMGRSLVPTGVAIELPPFYEAQVRPRSGLALKNGVTVLNSPGTIDADYRGEIRVILINFGSEDFVIERGMRIAQLVIATVAPIQTGVTLELSDTVRGVDGFGSTGQLAIQ